jgi:D-methionine transport system permease protein
MTSLLAFFAEIDWNDVAQAALDTLNHAGLVAGLYRTVGASAGDCALPHRPAAFAARPAAVSPAVIVRQRPAFAAVHHFADRDDPGDHLADRHLPGRGGNHSAAGGRLRPFFARLVETALREVDHGLVEASWSMGGSTWQLIWHTLLPESRAGLLAAVTVTAILLVDYTSMAGVIGGGGLGDLAIRFGYQRFQTDVMVVTVLLLIALVQLLQMSGDRLVRYVSRK